MSKIFAILRQLKYFVAAEPKRQSVDFHDLQRVVEKLGVKEQALLKTILETHDTEQKDDLWRDLNVIRMQRRKGLAAIEKLGGSGHR